MKLFIKNLTVETIVGILPMERTVVQPLTVDLCIEYDYEKGRFIDYAKLSLWLQELIKRRRYKVLEDAAVEILDRVFDKHGCIKYAKISLSKPNALPNGVASVELEKFFKLA